MYSAYKPKYWFWEIIEVSRRLMLTAVLSVCFNGSSIQQVLSIALSLIYLAIYERVQPYGTSSENAMSGIGSYQVLVTFLCGYVSSQQTLGGISLRYAMLGYVLVGVNSLVMLFSIYILFADYFEGLWKEDEDKSGAKLLFVNECKLLQWQ